MIPSVDQMMFCVMQGGAIIDGAHGLAIGETEIEAWSRAFQPCTDQDIARAKREGATVRRCALMVINP